jgi:hypothetical protein
MFSILGINNSKKNLTNTTSVVELLEQEPLPQKKQPFTLPLKFSDLSEIEIIDKINKQKFVIIIMIKLREYFKHINLSIPLTQRFYLDMLDLMKMKYKTKIGFFEFIDNIKLEVYYFHINDTEQFISRICDYLEKCKDITFLQIFYEMHIIPNIKDTQLKYSSL